MPSSESHSYSVAHEEHSTEIPTGPTEILHAFLLQIEALSFLASYYIGALIAYVRDVSSG